MTRTIHDGRRQRLALRGAALACFACLGVAAPPALASEAAPSVSELGQLSLEELSAIQVTSVSKRDEPLSQAPAAVYVITREDIRRSGATSLAEALRLAPNLDVERLNTASYTVTARGFNSPEAANKLLVLIDGRSVYTPLASTVFWETLGLLVEDIDRIEVISGPGGTLWGANAVNGVINVITRQADDSDGAFGEAGGGSTDRFAAVRLGGKLGDASAFRLYGQYRRSDLGGDGFVAPDAPFESVQGGFRLDGPAAAGDYTVQGDLYRNTTDFLDERLTGGNLLGRWRRELNDHAAIEIQAYYDQANRDYTVASDSLQTLDIQAQHDTALGERQRIVWGGEYRIWRSEFDSKVALGFPDPIATLNLASLFAQDEIALRPSLKLTLGMKLEDNSYSGLDYLPTARLAWQVSDRTLLWSSVSRAVRTPSRIDRELAGGGGLLGPSPDFSSETVTAYEVGYRGQPTPRLSLSVSAFYNVYDDLRTSELTNGGFPIVLANGLQGDTYGVEAWGKYAVTPWWRLSAGVSTLQKSLQVEAGHVDLAHMQAAGQDPHYHATFRSEMNLSDRFELDGSLRSVGRVSPSDVPAYVEADARIGWRVTDQIELSLAGFNLLHSSHLEVIDPSTAPVIAIPRSVLVSVRWEH